MADTDICECGHASRDHGRRSCIAGCHCSSFRRVGLPPAPVTTEDVKSGEPSKIVIPTVFCVCVNPYERLVNDHTWIC